MTQRGKVRHQGNQTSLLQVAGTIPHLFQASFQWRRHSPSHQAPPSAEARSPPDHGYAFLTTAM